MADEIKAVATVRKGAFGIHYIACADPDKLPAGTKFYTAQQFLDLVERATPAEIHERGPAEKHWNACRTQFLTTLTALVGDLEKGK